MGFTGQPVVTRVSGSLARITGLSLGSGATGTISLDEGGGDVKLPDSLNWSQYAGQDSGDGIVDLVEAVQVSYLFVEDVGDADAPSKRIAVTKSNGQDPSLFEVQFESFDITESQSAEMEIYLRFH
jgi:hypothetical protein